MKEESKERGKAIQAHWEKAAALYENPKTCLRMLEQSRPITPSERQKFHVKPKTPAKGSGRIGD